MNNLRSILLVFLGSFGLSGLLPGTSWAAGFSAQSEMNETLKKHPPDLGLHIHYGSGGKISALSESQKINFKPIQMEIQYQRSLPFGVFALGPALNYSNDSQKVYGYGGHFLYQVCLSPLQLIVPVIGYQWLRQHYQWTSRTGSNIKDQVLTQGFNTGIWINLGNLDKNSLSGAFANIDLKRAYLTAEYHQKHGADDLVDFSGKSGHLGLRLEF